VLFKRIISLVIVIDLFSFILSTEPKLIHRREIFYKVEGLSSTVFLMEYLARLIVCTENPKYKQFGPVMGRIHCLLSASMVIDALSTFPFFGELLVGRDLPRLTYLRFLRLLRITKTNGATRSVDAVRRVLFYNRDILYVASFTCTLLVLGTGVVLYYLRPIGGLDHPHMLHGGSAKQFQSILSTMYLSTMILTGQGGPDEAADLPWYTKAVVLLTSIVSVAMFAIPASMITWGFEAEAARMAKRAYRRSKRQKERRILGQDCNFHSSDSDYSTDEEYQKIIAGEEDDDSENDDPWMKELLERFANADEDGSGQISLKEFIALSGHGSPTVRSNGCSDGAALPMVMSRIHKLEVGQIAINDKLDEILQLLESKKFR